MKKNPFIVNKKLVVTEYTNNEEVTYFMSESFDKDNTVQLYKEGRDLVMNISPAGCKMFVYLCGILIPNQDYVIIDIDECMRVSNVKSKNTIYKQINELITNGILEKMVNNVYWINPHILFRGDRIMFYEKYYPSHMIYENVSA